MPYWHNQMFNRIPYKQLSRRVDYEPARHAVDYHIGRIPVTRRHSRSPAGPSRLAPGSCLALLRVSADTWHRETVGNNNPHNWWITGETRGPSCSFCRAHVHASAFSRITSHWGTPFLSSGYGTRHARSRCSRVQIRRNSFRLWFSHQVLRYFNIWVLKHLNIWVLGYSSICLCTQVL